MTPTTYSPLLTDFYQLTMAYGYWRLGMNDQQACFHLSFRKHPFQCNYAVACGLQSLVDFMQNWRFAQDDLDYLATLKNVKGEFFFPNEFLHYLKNLRFSCDVDAIPEGTVVFAQEPLLRIQGPLLQCQLLESALLNIMNFQTLIATKASRICRAAAGDSIIEFGMRRAQGPDGALSASRAAYIGGCNATSNTLAGKLFDIPVRGTHAHSWVSAFPSEKEAFAAYASIMPNNCVLLVDTYNTIEGVKNAIDIGKKLRSEGSELLAIRLDSGDLLDLSLKARSLLDAAGFKQTEILASNTLDEYVITDLKQHGAKITVWGVGTHLATAYDHPALDGVYKLSALQNQDGQWEHKLKLSEQEVKVSNPGRHQVRRYFVNNQFVTDVIYDLDLGIADVPETVLVDEQQEAIRLDDSDGFVDLLQPVFRKGKFVGEQPNIHAIRQKAIAEYKDFFKQHKSQSYRVALEKKLFELKQGMVKNHR